MVKNIAYGFSNEVGAFYVQACCDEEHMGQNCDCQSFGENFTEVEAESLAKEKSTELNVPYELWK